jgi:hypothetical protein
MPNENTFVENIKSYVLRYWPQAMFYRPNDARTSGVPDLFVFAAGRATVIEAKCPAGLPRNHEAPWLQHDFSPLQVAWLKKLVVNEIVALGLINVLSTGETWMVRGKDITRGMSYSFVKQVGVPIFDGTPAGQTQLKREMEGTP